MILFTLLSIAFLLWLLWTVVQEVRQDANLPLKSLAKDVVIGLGVLLTLWLVL